MTHMGVGVCVGEGGRVVLFVSLWRIAYEKRYLTHPLMIKSLIACLMN